MNMLSTSRLRLAVDRKLKPSVVRLHHDEAAPSLFSLRNAAPPVLTAFVMLHTTATMVMPDGAG